MEEKNTSLVREFQEIKVLPDKKILMAGVLVIILAGVVSGWALVKRGKGQSVGKEEKVKVVKSVGSTDVKTFKDSAIGVLEKGGVNGEGTHHLTREGGPSQTAYLTSSVINLDEYVAKKVRVWGETFAAEKAGWLMDVGRIDILE